MLDINRCFMRFSDRAERIDAKQIAETFVSVGPLLDVLDSRNNQLVYGRRGTGKTHALRYFLSSRISAGDVAVYVDCQNIGSNQSIYDDRTLPFTERATRLLIDVCSAVHAGLLDIFTDPVQKWDISVVAPLLDDFVAAISGACVLFANIAAWFYSVAGQGGNGLRRWWSAWTVMSRLNELTSREQLALFWIAYHPNKTISGSRFLEPFKRLSDKGYLIATYPSGVVQGFKVNSRVYAGKKKLRKLLPERVHHYDGDMAPPWR